MSLFSELPAGGEGPLFYFVEKNMICLFVLCTMLYSPNGFAYQFLDIFDNPLGGHALKRGLRKIWTKLPNITKSLQNLGILNSNLSISLALGGISMKIRHDTMCQ